MSNNKVVAFLNVWYEERNFGFANILEKDGSLTRYFVHRANIMSGTPARGVAVRFDALQGIKGLIAANVEIFANRQEMAQHDAAVALAQAVQKAGNKAGA